MHTDVLPSRDAFYRSWLNNFASQAAANASELGLTTEQVDALNAVSAAYSSAYEAHMQAKRDALAKCALKDRARSASEDIARSIAKFANANELVPSALKASMGLRAPAAPSRTVYCPEGLVVKADSNGANKLTWKRGENTRSVSFIIECQFDRTGPWLAVGFTSKVKFTHPGQIPGRPISYRVIATRNDKQSGPSNIAVTYGSELKFAA